MACDPKEVEDFIAAIPDGRREQILVLHHLIRELAPNLEPIIQKGVLGYGPYRYKNAAGRGGDWYNIGISNGASISLQFMLVNENGYLVEQAAPRLGKASCGKSCIRFKDLKGLNLDVVRELIETVAKTPYTSENPS